MNIYSALGFKKLGQTIYSDKIINEDKRINIDDSYGIIIQNNAFNDKEWDYLINCLRSILDTEDE